MYLGIDLGTSNSAIVGSEAGELRLFKTIEGTDVLPSAIMIDRRGNLLVGSRAYEQSAYAPDMVALGFKRLMGTSTALTFGTNGPTKSAEEASAEILKALVTQAKLAAGDFKLQGAVVTIPAAFNQMQSEATMRAAKLANISPVALLQEPIAAALSSIAKSKNKNGQFLVYDLGGGTFDVAIVQSNSGNANVVAHAGINMLGGRDFDRSLLNAVVRPWLLSTFDLPDDFQKGPTYQRLLRVAQYQCERSKISLSTQPTDRIFADESQLGVKDKAGSAIYLDVEITRGALEELVTDEVAQTINLCRSLLKDTGYKSDDIDRVVLIGGPTRMPIVRQKISAELGMRVDLDTDPMTAVATGAAIFAEDRNWASAGGGANRTRGSKKVQTVPDVSYEFPARTAEERIKIRIRVGSDAAIAGYRVIADTKDGWTSGRISVANGAEIKDVPIGPGENTIKLTLLDSDQNPVAGATSDVTVFRTAARAEGMPITHNIAVKIVVGGAGAERNTLHTLIKKGTSLPASGAEKFHSSRDLRAHDGGFLDFELFEQAENVVEPHLNLAIGAFRIDSTDLERGDVIRKGEEIFVHWAIDANGLLNCTYELPSIARTFKAQRSYVSTRDHKNFDGTDGDRIALESLASATDDVNRLDKALGTKVSDAVTRLQERLSRQREILELGHEPETRRSVTEESRLVRQEVSKLRSHPANVKAVLRAEIDDFVESFSTGLAQDMEPRIGIQINRLAGLARDALAKDDAHSIEDARRSYEEMRAIVLTDLAKKPVFWVSMFEGLANDRHRAIDKAKHDQYVREGEAAIKKDDVDGLRQSAFALRDNMTQVPTASPIDVLAGLMR